jgi:uracil-xanthine permease
MWKWKIVHNGKAPPPGESIGPMERMSWPRMVGVGFQHVITMFAGTFIFPVIMGLDANLAIMFSGICTIAFLLVTQNRVPSYLGTSASFVAGVAAIRAQGGDSADVTGAILVAGIALAVIGAVIHFTGSQTVRRILPPAVTGAVVMLIGFNLAPVVADTYWPQDSWVGLITAVFVVVAAVTFRGFLARIAVFLGLIFGFVVSWLFDLVFGPVTALNAVTGKTDTHDRVDLSGFGDASWFGFPSGTLGDGVSVVHAPAFQFSLVLLVLPAVIALTAENAGHVKAVGEMTGEDLDPYMGRAIAADGVVTAVGSAFGASPTTTYADNIGVMTATRVYSTAAYYIAGVVAIVLGLCPKFGVLIYAIPGGVLGGVSLVIYGMVGLIGVKIWFDNGVSFAEPRNMVPLAAGLIAGIGDVTLPVHGAFELTGIAFGTILVVVLYHLVGLATRRAQVPEVGNRGGIVVPATDEAAGEPTGV